MRAGRCIVTDSIGTNALHLGSVKALYIIASIIYLLTIFCREMTNDIHFMPIEIHTLFLSQHFPSGHHKKFPKSPAVLP